MSTGAIQRRPTPIRLLGRISLPAVVAIVGGCVIPLSPAATGDGGGGGGPDGSAGGPDGSAGGDSGPVVVGPDGAPVGGTWQNVTSNLAGMPSECGNMTSVHAKPNEDLLIAGVAQLGLWGSRDGGGTWQALGKGSGSAMITNRPQVLVFDLDPQHTTRFWEAGIYNGGGVYETTDDGNTFVQLGNAHHNDAVSVDLSDPARATLLAGGHEQAQTVYRSTDGGMTWTNIGAGLPANTNCTQPLVIDAKTYLVGCGGYGGGPSGVYRTTDSGATWTVATTSGGVDAPLRTADGSAIYWASPNGNGMTRSTDNGQSWNDVVGMGVVTSATPVELPDKRIAAIGHQAVLVSSDFQTWTAVTAALPYQDAVGLVYSPQQKAFFIWHQTCGFSGPVPVPADAIMRFDFDYTK